MGVITIIRNFTWYRRFDYDNCSNYLFNL